MIFKIEKLSSRDTRNPYKLFNQTFEMKQDNGEENQLEKLNEKEVLFAIHSHSHDLNIALDRHSSNFEIFPLSITTLRTSQIFQTTINQITLTNLRSSDTFIKWYLNGNGDKSSFDNSKPRPNQEAIVVQILQLKSQLSKTCCFDSSILKQNTQHLSLSSHKILLFMSWSRVGSLFRIQRQPNIKTFEGAEIFHIIFTLLLTSTETGAAEDLDIKLT